MSFVNWTPKMTGAIGVTGREAGFCSFNNIFNKLVRSE